MNYNTDKIKYYLKNILSIPSPTGYTEKVIDYIKEELHIINAYYYTTTKGAIIVSIKGKNDEYQRTLSAHVDTLGAMVKAINSDGTLSLTRIGGYMPNSIEGENCTIETMSGKTYTGTIQTIKPSVHISGQDAYKLERTEENMQVILDEKVSKKEDVEKLGIDVGDFICLDPRTIFTEKGFIKTRHLDDKASVGILLYSIYYILNNNIELPYTTNFLISNYEEVGHGASYIPPKTKEFVSVDMGAPGLKQNSSEYSVCICAKDSTGPYDFELRKKFIDICKQNNINYKVDIYPSYGSDASCAQRSGWDIKAGLIGPGVFASHAYERTHMDSILATVDLVINYCKSE